MGGRRQFSEPKPNFKVLREIAPTKASIERVESGEGRFGKEMSHTDLFMYNILSIRFMKYVGILIESYISNKPSPVLLYLAVFFQ